MHRTFVSFALLAALGAQAQTGAAAQLQLHPLEQTLNAAAQLHPPEQTLTLEEAVRRALQRNPSIEVALQEIDRANALLREVRSSSFPTISGAGAYTRLDYDRTITQPATPPATGNVTRVIIPKDSFNAQLNVSMPIFAPQRWTQWSHAGENVDVTRYSAEDVRRTVAVATARAYLAVFTQHRLVEVNEQSMVNARQHVDYTKARLDAGSGNRLDVVRSSQEAATAASLLSNSLIGLTRAKEALGVLVADEGPVDTVQQVPLPVPPTPDDAVKEAEANRQDVRAQRRRLEAADHVVRDSYADYLPLLTANFQPFWQSAASLTSPTTGWQASLVLSVPFYDGGLRYGLKRERSALAAEAKSQLEGLLRQARSDVRLAFESVRRADEALQSSQEAARLAQDSLQMTQLAYREGATNDLDVVDAERRARDASTQALISEDAARQARIDLLTASGRFP